MLAIIKIPWTGWLPNNRDLLLTVLGAGKSKIKVVADSVCGDSFSWFTDRGLVPVSSLLGGPGSPLVSPV